MKKLSLLISLILCVTIGGVYATWYYPSNDVTTRDVTIAVGLAGITNDTKAGTFTIEVADTLTPFVIDQESADSKDAVLTIADGVEIKLVFTPEADATDEILANGVTAQWYLKNSSDLTSKKYLGNQIFAYKAEYSDINSQIVIGTPDSQAAKKFTKVGNRFEYILNDDLLDAIEMGTFTLTNYDDYIDFQTALGTLVFQMEIAQKV